MVISLLASELILQKYKGHMIIFMGYSMSAEGERELGWGFGEGDRDFLYCPLAYGYISEKVLVLPRWPDRWARPVGFGLNVLQSTT